MKLGAVTFESSIFMYEALDDAIATEGRQVDGAACVTIGQVVYVARKMGQRKFLEEWPEGLFLVICRDVHNRRLKGVL